MAAWRSCGTGTWSSRSIWAREPRRDPDMASTGKAFTSIACGIMLNEFRDKIPQGLETKVFTENICPRRFRWTIRARRTSRWDSYFA